MLKLTFNIPGYDKVLQTIEEEVIKIFNKNVPANIHHINEVRLSEPRKSGLKDMDNILRADFKDAPMDLIIMLS